VVCVSCNLIGVLDCLYLRLRYTHDDAVKRIKSLSLSRPPFFPIRPHLRTLNCSDFLSGCRLSPNRPQTRFFFLKTGTVLSVLIVVLLFSKAGRHFLSLLYPKRCAALSIILSAYFNWKRDHHFLSFDAVIFNFNRVHTAESYQDQRPILSLLMINPATSYVEITCIYTARELSLCESLIKHYTGVSCRIAREFRVALEKSLVSNFA
jgi:hypothetical protein